MSNVLPTFRDNRDRIVYLLAEYKLPIAITALAAGVWVVAYTPQLPEIPPEALWFSGGWAILALPGYAFGLRVARYLYDPPWVRVAVADPGTEEVYDAKKVPPDLWEDKTVVGASPLRPDDGPFDYVVTRWNYYEGIGELEVRGCERADMTPGEALETKERVDEYYEEHHTLKRQYSRLKATIATKATEIHDLTLMQITAQREEAELAIDHSISDLIEEMEAEVEDLPDGPAPEKQPDGEQMNEDQFEAEDSGPISPTGSGSDTNTGEIASDGGQHE